MANMTVFKTKTKTQTAGHTSMPNRSRCFSYGSKILTDMAKANDKGQLTFAYSTTCCSQQGQRPVESTEGSAPCPLLSGSALDWSVKQSHITLHQHMADFLKYSTSTKRRVKRAKHALQQICFSSQTPHFYPLATRKSIYPKE